MRTFLVKGFFFPPEENKFVGEVEKEGEILLAFRVSRMSGIVKQEGEEGPQSIWASSREENRSADRASDW